LLIFYSYRFSLPTPTAILGLPIGQHISIAADLPQPDGKTKEILRSYTPISGDHQPGYFDLLIKSYPTGNISKYMASLIVGQTIKVRGPKGAMVYTPNLVRHFGMIAGGTGITPMLQIIRAVIRGRPTGDKTEIDLIFANVNPEDILLKEDLDELAKTDKGFRVHYVLNNPPAGWDGGVGFVTPEMMTVCPVPSAECLYLTCFLEMVAKASFRCQAPPLRSTTHDFRYEGSCHWFGLQCRQGYQQARAPSLRLLDGERGLTR
jgi:cytochrome-b5 reductase